MEFGMINSYNIRHVFPVDGGMIHTKTQHIDFVVSLF